MNRILTVIGALLCMFSVACRAADIKSDVPAPSESTIGVEAYQALFVGAGIGEDLPQLVVYGPSGRCLGSAAVTDASDLEAQINSLTESPQKTCAAVMSTQFGVTTVGKDSGLGRFALQLLVLDGPYCEACQRTEASFKRRAEQDPTGSTYLLTRINLGEAFNPTIEPGSRDCPACSQD